MFRSGALAACLGAGLAFADPASSTPSFAGAPREALPPPGERVRPDAAPALPRRPHAVYLDLLGKGGLWGFGYDYELRIPLALGATASFLWDRGQGQYSVGPYLSLYPVGRRHRWLLQLGPTLHYVVTRSPVPEWDGTRSTHLGGQLSTGYEHRGPLLFRASALLTFGRGGLVPWAGISVGHAF